MASNSSSNGWLRRLGSSPSRRQQSPPVHVELTECRAECGHNSSSTVPQNADVHDVAGDTRAVAIQPRREDTSLIRCASSGSGLPSALGTPPSPHGAPLHHGHNETAGQQQHAASPDMTTSLPQKGVRWLPGLHAQPQAQCSEPRPSGSSSSRQGGQVETGECDAAAAGQPLSSSGEAAVGTVSSSSRSGSSRAPLPSTDDQQLDRYLQYLLQEQHPHKFMYYPGWGLTEACCAAIGEFLRRDKRIKVMTLSGNSITDDGMELIAEGLSHNGCLLSLDLSDNLIGSVGAVALAEAMHSDRCRVAELQLKNNHIGDEGADALAAAVASSNCLKKLNLSGNPISSAQLDVVQHVLKTREYKLSSLRQPSRDKLHMRKCSSGLQFDIELIEGLARSRSSHGLLARQELTRLPPAMAVAALIEPKDALESSIGMQAAHLLAELGEQTGQCNAASYTAGCDASERSLTVMLAHRLACRGYDVVLRTCFPPLAMIDAVKSTAHHHHHHHQQQQQEPPEAAVPEVLASGLRHTFVRVSQPAPAEEAVLLPTVIVDPLFRDEFEMPHATARFTSTLDALPRVLCLAEARLFHLVALLCGETAAAFKECGLSLPPWRHTSAVMDKWLSAKYQDVVVDADSPLEALEKAVHGAAVPAS